MIIKGVTDLMTETRNQKTMTIGTKNGFEIARLINNEDQDVAKAVSAEIECIGDAIERAADKFKDGGRLIYIGAGTSGRLGALDAIELTPTYGVPAERAFGILAGGAEAMYSAVEGAEDSKELAVNDLMEVTLTSKDVLIGIAASGRTPYTISALEYGDRVGAFTIALTCNPQSQMAKVADISIAPLVGPEVITGSTRMKAGTAQKMVLNSLSTGIMIKSGYVYENLMINVQPTNEKLVARSIGIIEQILGTDEATATEIFENANRNIAVGLVMVKKHLSRLQATELLASKNFNINEIEGIVD
ncbi:N-acetylmuramic acid 6-phosphate etherase [Latilactobacillus graminis]|uniref:N-acetylmuramic acid 6-phosphate etherase n=2 Tax=Latilactobacillus graminis TaxID=60519 RepID=A0AA89I2Y6_9LACO|nr:N-acetylmuramic acid 6-phosphate etherase [Latilactobacillus graminis]KRM23663.1 N-acetylmuramic acid 6-phosphate etherase [Latilactobacillus graminis DSM 20719]QFP80150.1 N-acetylmuramic acid 6-phosphate etherase [Latilactobacillus graminis]